MLSIAKRNTRNVKEGVGVYEIVEIRGLSTDTKPTTIEDIIIDNGSVFIEIDTGNVYLYDLATTTWNEV